MPKHNDNSTKFSDWTTKKLKQEAVGYHQLIYGNVQCYGTSDLRIYDGILNELANRGIEPRLELAF